MCAKTDLLLLLVHTNTYAISPLVTHITFYIVHNHYDVHIHSTPILYWVHTQTQIHMNMNKNQTHTHTHRNITTGKRIPQRINCFPYLGRGAFLCVTDLVYISLFLCNLSLSCTHRLLFTLTTIILSRFLVIGPTFKISSALCKSSTQNPTPERTLFGAFPFIPFGIC